MIDLRPGDVLRHKYRLDHVLGQGGMAVVWAATHLTLQQRVAVKLLRPGSPNELEVIEPFLREARAACRLEGPNVTRVLEDFSTTAIDVFWSGSPAGSGAAWAQHFSTGRAAETSVTARNRVRCVR